MPCGNIQVSFESQEKYVHSQGLPPACLAHHAIVLLVRNENWEKETHQQ